MESNIVVKSNRLVEARYNLSLNEQKILLLAISKLDQNDPSTNWVDINLQDISSLISSKGKRYDEFRGIARNLRKKELIIDTEENELITGWISSVQTHKNKGGDRSGKVTLRFDDQLIPYLFKLKEQFTRYNLENILFLKNKYSIKMYELLKQYEKIGVREYEIEELKRSLCCEDKYTEFKDFKKRVVDKTVAEINKNTDIIVSFDKITKKNKTTGIRYYIKSKEKENERDRLLREIYDIDSLALNMGVEEESWTPTQISAIYEIACDIYFGEETYLGVKNLYLKIKENKKIKNRYAYLKKVLEDTKAQS